MEELREDREAVAPPSPLLEGAFDTDVLGLDEVAAVPVRTREDVTEAVGTVEREGDPVRVG